MAPELVFLLLALVGLLSFSDLGSSDDTDEADTTDDSDDPEPVVLRGTGGDDLLVGDGGMIIRGLQGDDTLVTTGGDTMYGGQGDDTLVALGGGATLYGGPGDDTFVIDIRGVDADGTLQDTQGATVAPTVIGDFNPDTDRLVIDLRQSPLAASPDSPVTLTGTLAPDGEGLMVQVDGVNVVQLSTYGGGDMQAALEYIDVEVIGAAFEFPVADDDGVVPDEAAIDPDLPAGVGAATDEDGITVFRFNESYSGGGSISGSSLDVIDLSALRFDVVVTMNADGSATVGYADQDQQPTVVTGIETFILGGGDDVFDARGAARPFWEGEELIRPSVSVTASEGFNEIYGGPGENYLITTGGDNRIIGGEGINRIFAGAGNDEIIAGSGPNFIDAFGLQNYGTSVLPVLMGPTDVQGSTTGDFIIAGLGDTVTGNGGGNTFVILGAGPEGAGPAIITGFDRGSDLLFYDSVLRSDGDTPGVVTLQDTDRGVAILEDGEVMVIVENTTADDLTSMSSEDFRTDGTIRLDLGGTAA